MTDNQAFQSVVRNKNTTVPRLSFIKQQPGASPRDTACCKGRRWPPSYLVLFFTNSTKLIRATPAAKLCSVPRLPKRLCRRHSSRLAVSEPFEARYESEAGGRVHLSDSGNSSKRIIAESPQTSGVWNGRCKQRISWRRRQRSSWRLNKSLVNEGRDLKVGGASVRYVLFVWLRRRRPWSVSGCRFQSVSVSVEAAGRQQMADPNPPVIHSKR